MARSAHEQIEALRQFSPCDVSDALLKLEKPAAGRPAKGGFLADIGIPSNFTSSSDRL